MSIARKAVRFQGILTLSGVVALAVLVVGAIQAIPMNLSAYIGETGVSRSPLLNIATYVFVAGVLAFAGFFFLVFYLLRNKEPAPGYFAVICLGTAANILLPNTSLLPIDRFFPWLTGPLVIRLDIATLSLAVAGGPLLLREFFPLDVPRKSVGFLSGICAFVLVSVLVLPAHLIGSLFRTFVAVAGGFSLFAVYVATRALLLRRPDARLMASGIFIVGVAGAVDMLTVLGLTPARPLALPIALIIVTGVMSVIIARRFAGALGDAERSSRELREKNRALMEMDAIKEEVRRKTRQEQHLKMMQRRLTEMLDKVPLPVCAVEDDGTVVFSNEQIHQVLGISVQDLRGKSIDGFVQAISQDGTMASPLSSRCAMPESNGEIPIVVTRIGSDDPSHRLVVEMIPLSIDDEDLKVLVFSPLEGNQPIKGTFRLFIQELNLNRRRLERLDRVLARSAPGKSADFNTVRDDLRAIDSALSHMSSVLREPDSNRREIALNVMALSYAYWRACTGKSVLELAVESGLWRVEMTPDGFGRARTLDRYLDIRTFPQMPRWKKILSTGDFVLSHCSGNPELRAQLEASMSHLRIT